MEIIISSLIENLTRAVQSSVKMKFLLEPSKTETHNKIIIYTLKRRKNRLE